MGRVPDALPRRRRPIPGRSSAIMVFTTATLLSWAGPFDPAETRVLRTTGRRRRAYPDDARPIPYSLQTADSQTIPSRHPQ